MKDKKTFQGFMLVIGELFDKNPSKELLDMYWKTFEPFNDKECKKAFKKVLATAKFFPKPADFLEYLQDGVPHMLAWDIVFKAIKEVGPYMSVKFTDPAIHLTIELMGGWPTLCTMENDDIKWKQIEFEKIYKGVCQRGAFPQQLLGIIEEENLKTRKLDHEAPLVLVGSSINSKLLNS